MSATPKEKSLADKKRKETCLAKYGVTHVLKIPGKAKEVAEKGNPKRIETLLLRKIRTSFFGLVLESSMMQGTSGISFIHK